VYYNLWSNKVIHAELRVSTIREEITKFIKSRDKIKTHPNELASTLLEEETLEY
jgi:hypothetical protein